MLGVFQYLQMLGPNAKEVAKTLHNGAIAAKDRVISAMVNSSSENASNDKVNETTSKVSSYFKKVSESFGEHKKERQIEKISQGILKLEKEIENLKEGVMKLEEMQNSSKLTSFLQSSISERRQELLDLQERLKDINQA